MTEQPIGPEEVKAMREDYYHEQGWDPKTGLPTRERLRELGQGEELA